MFHTIPVPDLKTPYSDLSREQKVLVLLTAYKMEENEKEMDKFKLHLASTDYNLVSLSALLDAEEELEKDLKEKLEGFAADPNAELLCAGDLDLQQKKIAYLYNCISRYTDEVMNRVNRQMQG